jgi:hypothetical protein
VPLLNEELNLLKSHQMNLSGSELHWLPTFGKTSKLAMGWACFLNRRRYPVLEQTFEGIASNRVNMLCGWAKQQWELLESLAREIEFEFPEFDEAALCKRAAMLRDLTEIFVLDANGQLNQIAGFQSPGKTQDKGLRATRGA